MGELIFTQFPISVNIDIPIALTKSVSDIFSPETRQSTFSKSFNIDGNIAVNQAFTFIFDINNTISNTVQYAPSFNPNKRATVIYKEDGVVQMEGYLRLIEIVKLLETSEVQYNCQIFSTLADFWNDISKKKMAEIDLTKYNHNLSASLVRKSWDQNVVLNGIQVSFAKGKGYVHGLINKRSYGGTLGVPDPTMNWEVGDTTPMIYAKELVDEIYRVQGAAYAAGGFFSTAEFLNWVVPYNGIGLDATDATINNNKVIAERTTNLIDNTLLVKRPSTGTIIYQNDSTGGNQDINGNYNATLGRYTVPATGLYNGFFYTDLFVEINEGAGGTLDLNNNFEFVIKNITTGQNFTSMFTANWGGTPGTYPTFSNRTFFVNQNITNIKLNAGDIIEFAFNNYLIATDTTTNTFWNFLPHIAQITATSKMELKQQSIYYGSGSLVNFANFFADKLTQKDFMLDLAKTFNLMFDLDSAGNHIVKTRDNYYGSTVINLEKYLNSEKEVVYQPMGLLDANPYVLTYTKDDDSLNELYLLRNQELYGTREFDVDNDFIKNKKEIAVKYSSTPMRHFDQSNMSLCDITFYDKQGNVDSGKNNNYRFLRFEGIKPCNQYTLKDDTNITLQTGYPLIGHIDDAVNPTLCGLFGMPNQHYLNPNIKYSNNNLFFRNHLKFYSEITNINSKLVKAFLNITPDLFEIFTFDKLYYFDNSYFILNKYSDYRPYEDTQCEFLKLINFTKPVAGSSTGNGGRDDRDVFNIKFPTFQNIGNINKNKGFATGTGNFGNHKAVMIGDNNTANGKSQISILSNKTTVLPQVDWANVIGLDAETINQDGIYLNGKHVILKNLPTSGAEANKLFDAGGFVKVGNAIPPTVGVADVILIKTANQISNIITFAKLEDFTFSVVAGKVYKFDLTGTYQTELITTGIRIGVYLSGGATGTIGGYFYGAIDNTAAATELKSTIRAIGASALAGSNLITTGVAPIDQPHSIGAEFYFSALTSGVIDFEMASEVATSNSQFNIGSTLIIKTLN